MLNPRLQYLPNRLQFCFEMTAHWATCHVVYRATACLRGVKVPFSQRKPEVLKVNSYVIPKDFAIIGAFIFATHFYTLVQLRSWFAVVSYFSTKRQLRYLDGLSVLIGNLTIHWFGALKFSLKWRNFKKPKKTAKKHFILAVFWRLFNSDQIWAHQTNILIFSIKFLISRHPRDFCACLNSGDIFFGEVWSLLSQYVMHCKYKHWKYMGRAFF